MKKLLLAFLFILSMSSVASAALSGTVYYVRPDGGTSTQCTGLIDAPYSGTGSAQPCALSHPA